MSDSAPLLVIRMQSSITAVPKSRMWAIGSKANDMFRFSTVSGRPSDGISKKDVAIAWWTDETEVDPAPVLLPQAGAHSYLLRLCHELVTSCTPGASSSVRVSKAFSTMSSTSPLLRVRSAHHHGPRHVALVSVLDGTHVEVDHVPLRIFLSVG